MDPLANKGLKDTHSCAYQLLNTQKQSKIESLASSITIHVRPCDH